jgi:hypothetical protein
MLCIKPRQIATLLTAATLLGGTYSATSAAVRIEGQVQAGGGALAGSTVSLYSASVDAPTRLAQVQTDADGHFVLANDQTPGGEQILYLIASGGVPAVNKAGGNNPAIELLTVVGNQPPAKVIINEMTSVASAFTAARFIHGESISGNPLGLRIAAMNVPNLVNLQSGSWGAVIVDGLNLTRSTTLSNLNTLASLVTYASTSASSDWRSRFFRAATPTGGTTPSNTLSAIAGIARESWAHPKELFGLFEEAYPQAKEGLPNAAPFAPYLLYAPNDFALILRFSGGGLYAPGRLMFDADSNLWSGANWMPGSQSNSVKNIGGGTAKFGPDGSVLSPPVTGFMGAGINGVGWGTAVTRENVWISSFNGRILVMDLQGHPVASEQDFPFREKLSGLMGIGVAANGDVWIADAEGGQLLFFPGGRVKEGRIVKVAGLAGPFDVVIDDQNRVWVSNSRSDTVVRFPANDPTKVETFRVGVGPRALALDSKNNVWVVSFLSPDFPGLKPLPPNASIMQEFAAFNAIVSSLQSGRVKATGFVSMILSDGSQQPQAGGGYSGDGAISIPWGINLDGNDDVWTTNGWTHGIVYMAGDNTKGHSADTKTGNVLHLFASGAFESFTDVSIDAAGNAWCANNWNDLPIATGMTQDPARSTWGGGTGINVIYGVAEPVQPPRMGKVRPF